MLVKEKQNQNQNQNFLHQFSKILLKTGLILVTLLFLPRIAMADHIYSAQDLKFTQAADGTFSITFDWSRCGGCTDAMYLEYYVVEQGCSPSDGFTTSGNDCVVGFGNDIPLASGITLCEGKTYDILLFARRMDSRARPGDACNTLYAEDRDGHAIARGDLIRFNVGDCGTYPWNGTPMQYDDRTIVNRGPGGSTYEDAKCPYDQNWAYLILSYTTPGNPIWSFSADINVGDCLGASDQSYSGNSVVDGSQVTENFGGASAMVLCGSPISVTYNSNNSCGPNYSGNTFTVIDNSTFSGLDASSSGLINGMEVVDDNGMGRFEELTNGMLSGYVCGDGDFSIRFENAECTSENSEITVDVSYSLDVHYPTSNFAQPTKVNCGDVCSSQDLILSGTDQWVNTGLNTGASTTIETSDATAKGFSFTWDGQVCTETVIPSDCQSGTANVYPDQCATCGIYDISYTIANSNCEGCETSTTKQIQIVSPRITNLATNMTQACGDFTPTITFDVVECNPTTGAATVIPYTGAGSRFIERSDDPGNLMPEATANLLVSKGTTVSFTAYFQTPGCSDCNTQSVGSVTVSTEDDTKPTAICQNITASLDANGMVTIAAADIDNGSNDACGIASIALNKTDFTCANVGNNSVTLTVTDTHGNIATCNATVTVEDKVAPNAICQDITVQLNAAGMVTIAAADIDNGSNDACGIASITLDKTNFTCAEVGMNTVTLTVTDNNGNTSTCNATVTVEDMVDPTAICQDITVQLNAAGMASIIATDIDNGSNDACGIASITLDKTSFNCTNIGVNTVTLTVTDNNGNTATCSATVTVEDNVAPNAVCQDLTIQLNAAGMASITASQIDNGSSDPCGIASIVLNKTTFSCSNLGANTITLTVTDNNGNTATCTASVIVVDMVSPAIVCPVDVTISTDDNCHILLADYTDDATTSDNCSSVSNILVSQSPAAGTMLKNDGTVQVVTLTATDESGNTGTCQFNVTLDDTTDPYLACPSNDTLSIDGTCPIGLPDYTGVAMTNDNCSADGDIILSQSPAAGTMYSGEGTEVSVTITATDENGNNSQCSFLVRLEDMSVPSISCPAAQIIQADGNCNAVIPDYTGMASVNSTCSMGNSGLSITQLPIAGTIISNYNTVQNITLTVDDGNGNTNNCTFSISIADTLPPSIVCPPDVTLQLDDNCESLVGDYIDDLTIGDNCTTIGNLNVTQTPPNGTTVDESVTSVVFNIEDEAGNMSQCVISIIYEDKILPELTCPSNQDIIADANCQAKLGDYTGDVIVSDNCTMIGNLIITQTPPADTIITGTNTTQEVIITVEDEAGNSSICNLIVTLRDNVDPEINCPSDQILQADANCQHALQDYTLLAITSDNCNTQPGDILVTQSPDPGTIIDGLDTIFVVTLTAKDKGGNVVSCNFNVQLEDKIKPTFNCPPDTILYIGNTCSEPIPDYRTLFTPIDNCSIDTDFTVTQTPTPGTLVQNSGTIQTITIDVADESGNTTSCLFMMSIQDTIKPTIVCPANTELFLNSSCQVVVPDYRNDATVDDNCTAENNIMITQTPPPGTIVSDTTTLTILLVADDNNGNTSQCTFMVVKRDTIPADFVCPDDQTLLVDNMCNATIPDYRGGLNILDNCSTIGTFIVTQTPPEGTVLNGQGTMQTVVIKVTDNSGNIDSCDFTITLEDDVPPSITCPDLQTVYINNTCQATLPDFRSLATISDNCTANGAITLTQSPLQGITVTGEDSSFVVTITADDNNGNTVSCDFMVMLRDTIKPMIICPADQVLYSDAGCANLIPDYRELSTPSDNCQTTADIVLTQIPAPATEISGLNTTQTITITADDTNGNTVSCSFLVTLQDNTPPTLICPDTQYISVDGICEVPLPDYTGHATISDNCTTTADLIINQIPPAGTMVSEPGTIDTIVLTLEDEVGNKDTCEFVIVLEDSTNPMVTCPGDKLLYVNDDCRIILEDYTHDAISTSICSMADPRMSYIQTPPAGTFLSDNGTVQEVTIIALDGNGNSDTCSFNVTLVDTIKPVLMCPISQELFMDANCQILVPDYRTISSYIDNCTDDHHLDVDQFPLPGTVIDIVDMDSIEVTITVTDAVPEGAEDGHDINGEHVNSGGNQVECTFTVFVTDAIKPTIVCPADTMIFSNSNCVITVPNYTSLAVIGDNCSNTGDLTVTQDPVEGTEIFETDTIVLITLNIVDESGNTNFCNFNLQIKDTIPASILCPLSQVLIADGNCEIIIPDYRNITLVDDNCSDLSQMTLTQSPVPGFVLAGADNDTTVTIVVDDGYGNISSCSFQVSILDNTPPEVTCPPNRTLYVDENCQIAIPDFEGEIIIHDGCSSPSDLIYAQSPTAGTILMGHETAQLVTISITDESGNISQCTLEVILADTTKPVLICPDPQTIDCQASLPDYRNAFAITDNCTPRNGIIVTQNPAAGYIFPEEIPSIDVWVIANDGNGNIDSCTFTVSLVDTTPPALDCPFSQTINVDDDCGAFLPDYRGMATIADDCSDFEDLVVTQTPSPNTFYTANDTLIIVSITARDESGNISECLFSVRFEDDTAPTLSCLDDYVIEIDASNNCSFTIPNYLDSVSTINTCNTNNQITLIQFPVAGVVIDSLSTVQDILIIAKDDVGNADSCTFKVFLTVSHPESIVTEGVTLNQIVDICPENLCLVPGKFTAMDCDGNTQGKGTNGSYQIDPVTGCVKYTVSSNPTTPFDEVCVVFCDNNGFCDTVDFIYKINPIDLKIYDPCTCLNNESSLGAGDGQFAEKISIRSFKNEHWYIIQSTGFYQNPTGTYLPPTGGSPYPLNNFIIGSNGVHFIETVNTSNLTTYELEGIHVTDVGYYVQVTNGKDTLEINNYCSYENTCASIAITTNPDGTPDPSEPECEMITENVGNVAAISTLKDCNEGSCTEFRSDGAHDLYTDTIAKTTMHIICPPTKWQTVTLNISDFDLAEGDTLFVFEGQDTTGAPLHKWSGKGVSKTGGWVSSHCDPNDNPTGCLTFLFKTNGDNKKGTGWRSKFECQDRGISLIPPNILNAKLVCGESSEELIIKSATILADCDNVVDSQFVTIENLHGAVCFDTVLVMGDEFTKPFAIGKYLVKYRLKSDTAKTTETSFSVQANALVCNDEVNTTLGAACGLLFTPDMLLEGSCDTLTDTIYYFIKVYGTDKNGKEELLVSGGGKGNDYPFLTKEMIDECSGTFRSEIEIRYYEDLNMAICNNGPKSLTCEVDVNIFDNLAPIFLAPEKDTFKLCLFDLTEKGLGIVTPKAVDNCTEVAVKFEDAKYLRGGQICDTSVVEVTWIASDSCGNSTQLIQEVVILRPNLTDIVKTHAVVLSCSDSSSLDNLIGDNVPKIRTGKVKNGVIDSTTLVLESLNTETYVCGYILQKRDIEISPNECGKKVIRYWELLDWCDKSTGVFPLDTTFFEYRDTTAPVFVEKVLDSLTIVLDHNTCTFDFNRLNKPLATDDCSIPTVELDSVFRIEENGELWSVPVLEWANLAPGAYKIEWISSDNCHLQLDRPTIDQKVTVIDDTAPVAICVDRLHLSFGNSIFLINPEQIDAGSYDACGITLYEVSRDGEIWGPMVEFTCEDIHENPKVYLRVSDYNGNYSECWTTVIIEDKVSPVCSDLPIVNIDCDSLHGDNYGEHTDINQNKIMDDTEWVAMTIDQAALFDISFGTPQCSDNIPCRNLEIEQQYQLIAKACGEKQIKRRFRARDWNGEGSQSNWYSQEIYLNHKADWKITFPADYKGVCGTDIPDSEVIIETGSCNELAYETEQQEFISVEGACLKVIRTFTIINWCNYSSEETPLRITRVADGNGIVKNDLILTSDDVFDGIVLSEIGKLEYTQVLKIEDNDAPNIMLTTVDTCINANDCGQLKQFSISATDCNDASNNQLVYKWSIYSDEEELDSGIGNNFEFFVNANSTYKVKWKVEDNCGNSAWEIQNFTFTDCRKPNPYCIGGITLDLMDNGHIEVWATDLTVDGSDNCTDSDRLKYRIWHHSNGEIPNSTEAVLALPENLTLKCAYLGTQTVHLYVIDDAGNYDYCVSKIDVQDNRNACQVNEMAMIQGVITDWKNRTVEEVKVRLMDTNDNFEMTNKDGAYQFELEMHHSYVVKPEKNDNPLNGVSTYDLVLISKHILGLKLFDNPYQWIAADVNQSQSITAYDMVQLRRMILGIEQEFSKNTSWKFVNYDYEFTTAFPLSETYPNQLEVASLDNNMDHDFIAIKIGDVNASAIVNNLTVPTSRSHTNHFEINVTDQAIKAGKMYTVNFETKQLRTIQGHQFTLNYDALEVIKWMPGLCKIENFGLNHLEDGYITSSWHNISDKNISNSTNLFSINFLATRDGKLSDFLYLNSTPTIAESYDNEGNIIDVKLNFLTPNAVDKFELYQNIPNPFKDQTTINFYLSKNSEYTLIFQDETGRTLDVITGKGKMGINSKIINSSNLPDGIIIYQLKTSFGVKTMKMIHIK